MNNTGVKILSILIPSIPERSEMLYALTKQLHMQIMNMKAFEMLGEVELLPDAGVSYLNGGLSIGKKREGLVRRAEGKYVCFLDDDESIAPNYIETLLRLCNCDLDVCTFRALVKMEASWGLVNMRLAHKVNEQYTPEYTIRRPPWHMCPVRSEFAKLYEFEDSNNGEDYSWYEKVLNHCTTEAHTDKILFQYNHGAHSEADKITNHEQG
jgi:hypothetical protein